MMELDASMFDPIAVIGMACRFPGGVRNPHALLQLLQERGEAITEVPSDRWDPTAFDQCISSGEPLIATQRGGFLDSIDQFDTGFFGISPNEARSIDPQHRLLLETAWHAIEDAGLPTTTLQAERVAVFGGLGGDDYAKRMLRFGNDFQINPFFATGNAASPALGRLSQWLGLRGPAVTVDTACSSSAVCLHLASRALQIGDCTIGIAAGVNLILDPAPSIALSRARMLSPQGRCRTFDNAADGYVRSEGCGVVILKRLVDALADGDRIHGVITGSALNHDGHAASLTTPKGPSQVEVMRLALAAAGVQPEDVDYVEAHGTGTPLGDPIELRALQEVYGSCRNGRQPIPIGSIKANIGHCEAAAGIASFIKALLVLKYGVPPQPNFDTPTKHFSFEDSGLSVAASGAETGPIRRAAVSSFGFSGTNAHLIAEAPPARGADKVRHAETTPVLLLSAKTEAALEQLVIAHRSATNGITTPEARRWASASASCRSHFAFRVATVAEDAEALTSGLEAIAADFPAHLRRRPSGGRPRVAFLFSGQGEQSPGMARELFENDAVFRAAFETCELAIEARSEIRLRDILYGEQSALLAEPRWIQLGLFTVQYAMARMWQGFGVTPDAVTGHSLGEIAAATIAGIYEVEEAVDLVIARSAVMARLPDSSAMAAVMAPASRVAPYLDIHRGSLSIAAINAPAVVTIAGDGEALAALRTQLDSDGIPSRMMPEQVKGFHSPLLDPILHDFEEQIDHLCPKEPSITWFSSSCVDWIHGDELAPSFWRRHMREPVLFHDAVRALIDDEVTVFVEIGPSAVLSGLGRRASNGEAGLFVATAIPGRDNRVTIAEAASALYLGGVDVDWTSYLGTTRPADVPLPKYPFQRKRYWLDLDGASAPPMVETAASPRDIRPASPSSKMTDYYGVLAHRDSEAEAEGTLIRFAPFATAIPGFAWLRVHAQRSGPHFDQALAAREHMWRMMLEPIRMDAVGRIADVGCGFGSDVLRLAEAYPAIQVDGFNISSDQIDFARGKATRSGFDNARFSVLDLSQAALPGAYDLIFALQVFHHIEDKSSAIANVAGSLGSGGYLIMAEILSTLPERIDHPSSTSYFETQSVWADQLAENGLRVVYARDLSDEIANYLDDPDFEATLEEVAGLESEAVRAHLWGPHLLGGLLRRGVARYLIIHAICDPHAATADLAASNRASILAERHAGAAALPVPLEAGNGRADLRAVLAAVTGWNPGQMRSDDLLQDYGIDSLMALDIRQRIYSMLGIEIGSADLMTNLTFGQLETMVRERAAQPVAPAPSILTPQVERHEPFNLTDIQQAYWIGRREQIELGGVGAHFYIEIERAEWDIERLEIAWNQVIARHEMLRTIILDEGMQQLLDDVPQYRFRRHDLRDFSRDEVDAAIIGVRGRLSHEVRDLQCWPPFSLEVAILPAGRVRLFFSIDIVFVDALSTIQIAREWHALYEEPTADLPTAPIEFQDCMRWRDDLRLGDQWNASLAYWRERIGTLPDAPRLPTRDKDGSEQGHRFVRRAGRLTGVQWQAFRQFARDHRMSPSVALLTAYCHVLARWSASPDFTLAVTLYNRPAGIDGIQHVVGDFTSIDLLHIHLRSDASFVANGQAIRDRLLADLDHSIVTGVEVVRELNRAAGTVQARTFPIVFTSAINDLADSHQDMSWLSDAVYGITQTPQVLLDHAAYILDGELAFHWDSVDSMFEPDVLDAMFDRYERLLVALADHAETWESLVSPGLPEAQLQRRAAANATEAIIGPALLDAPFWAMADDFPDLPAVITPDLQFTYGELAGLSAAYAGAIADRRVNRENPIGVSMQKGWAQVIAVLAAMRAGYAYVPIDPEFPAERRRLMMEMLGIELLLCDPVSSESVSETMKANTLVITNSLPQGARDQEVPQRSPDDPAYIIFTSGSTGIPKAVAVAHAAASNTVVDINRRLRVGPNDRVLGVSSLGFDLSVYDIFGTLGAGACLVLPSPGRLPDPGEWVKLVEIHGVTLWNSVPMLFDLLVDAAAEPAQLASLRTAMLSGDWIPVRLAQHVRNQFPELLLLSLGGATEASIWSLSFTIENVDPAWTAIPYGRPLSNQRMDVRSPDFQPCPEWVAGEIVIMGTGLASGYCGDPELTEQRFPRDPLTGNRLYRTGDLGRYDDQGNILLLGRLDDQVKLRGYRIELGEIEATAQTFPSVRTAIAAIREDPRKHRRLILYIVPAAGFKASDLRSAMSMTLPEHMLPQHIIEIDAIPLSPNGKVDRNALPEPGWHDDATRLDDFGELGLALAEIWEEILGIRPVSMDDHFLAMGGDSLLATRMLQRCSARFNIPASALTFYDRPEFGAQLATLEAILENDIIADVPETGAVGETPWFASHPLPLPPCAAHQLKVVVEGPLDVDALNVALQHLLHRHPTLLAQLRRSHGRVVKTGSHRIVDSPLRITDDPGPSIDSNAGKLFDVRLDGSGDLRHLCLEAHPWLADLTSLELVLRDLVELYGEQVTGEACALPVIDADLEGLASRRAKWLESDALTDQIGYWRTMLKFDIGPGIHGPVAPLIPAATFLCSIDARLNEAISKWSRDHRVAMPTAYLLALAEASAQDRDSLRVTLVIPDRRHDGTAELAGPFSTEMLLIMARGSNAASVDTLIRRTYENRDVPFGWLAPALEDADGGSLADFALTLFDTPAPLYEAGGVAFLAPSMRSGSLLAPLAVTLRPSAEMLSVQIDYDPAQYSADGVQDFAGRFLDALRAIADPSDQPQANLPPQPQRKRARRKTRHD